jgi:hypothetical protein
MHLHSLVATVSMASVTLGDTQLSPQHPQYREELSPMVLEVVNGSLCSAASPGGRATSRLDRLA